jgi:hypothetical protein
MGTRVLNQVASHQKSDGKERKYLEAEACVRRRSFDSSQLAAVVSATTRQMLTATSLVNGNIGNVEGRRISAAVTTVLDLVVALLTL